LQFYDRRVATGSVIDILKSLRDIEGGLKSAYASEYFGHHFIAPLNQQTIAYDGVYQADAPDYQAASASRLPVSQITG
jgi:hypothetical protein